MSKRHALETLLIGRSPSIEKARSIILRLAHTRAAVLITGETGTGKEQVAKYLHTFGGWTGNFVALNCGGLPETLLESELFGHEPGAFTGATKRRIGKIEHAHKGTLFLDEIESMPCSQQVKLLRILQEQEVERLGSNTPIAVDCRVVAAAKGELGELCRRSRFREDLYYRLNVVPIELPPLRDRREDIPPLFRHFVLQAALRFGRDVPSISSTQIEKLLRHSWPGNVRELGNVASRFVLGLADHTESSGRSSEASSSLSVQMSNFERCLIEEELRKRNGCVVATSQALGLPKTTLYEKIRKHQLALKDFNGKVSDLIASHTADQSADVAAA